MPWHILLPCFVAAPLLLLVALLPHYRAQHDLARILPILTVSIPECSAESDVYRVPRMEAGQSDRHNTAGRSLEGDWGKEGIDCRNTGWQEWFALSDFYVW